MKILLILLLLFPNALSWLQAPQSTISYSKLWMAKKKGKDFKQTKQEAPTKKEIQGRADQFDALTRKFMFTITKLTKKLPDSERMILKNINLCFYPGAKIGVVGLNGSGKSSLLRIMAGIDKEFDGVAVPMPGASVGYLAQEPSLEGITVMDNINLGVKKSQELLDRFSTLSVKMTEPLPAEEMSQVMEELSAVQDNIEAGNLWELDRIKERAMDALRCPPADAEVSVLSGGEKRRVAIARLLLENHDLLLLGMA
jgi:ATPase subunit of ABC transporter with duplicated ATPase domains